MSFDSNPSSLAPNISQLVNNILGTSPANKDIQFNNGGIYNAVITNFNSKNNTLTIQYDLSGLEEEGCIWGAAVFSGMFGFNLNYIPPIGTQVVVAKGSPSVIVGCRSSFAGNQHLNEVNTATGEAKLLETTVSKEEKENGEISFDQTGLPSDLLPGEFDLSNVYGVAITMLSNLAKVSAGDLAKVECHLLNDMVRILSTNFKHHTAWGDIEFYNDGRLNVVINGTSYPHEAFGLKEPSEKKYEANTEEGVDLTNVDEVNDTGRWRLSQYVGFLGNFIHTIISDPPDALGSIANGQLQAGKARVHVNNDGTILCQSVSDIVLERVTRIPVPRMKKRWEDGSGTKPSDFDKLEKKFLKIWNEKSDSLHHTAYQLREYARYLSLFHSYSRFLQLSESDGADYEIPSEEESPDPRRDNSEPDVKEANSDIEQFYDTYSTIRIMRDGSIVIWDGYGSSVVMSHGDIQHSAVRNFTIEAAGDIRINAGRNLFINAYKSIEIVSVVGGLKLKARAWFHALCEWGTLLLKSDAKDIRNDTTLEPDTPEDETDPQPLVGDAAIVLDSSKGRTSILSQNTIALEVAGSTDAQEESDYSRSIILRSKYQHIKMFAFKSLHFESQTGIIAMVVSQAKSIIMRGSRIFADVNNFILGEYINLCQGISTIPSVLTKSIWCHGAVFSKTIKSGFPPHEGHTFKFSEKAKKNLPVPLREQKALASVFDTLDEDNGKVDEVLNVEEKAFPTNGYLVFSFNNYAAYVPEPSKFFQSPAQQYIRLDWSPTDPQDEGFVQVRPENLRLKTAPRTLWTTGSFPGIGAQYKVYESGEDLRKPSPNKADTFDPADSKLEMKDSPYVFWRVK